MDDTICDYCGMPSATVYILSSESDGTAPSHSICDACAMEVGQEAESSDDEETVIVTDGSVSSSESELDSDTD